MRRVWDGSIFVIRSAGKKLAPAAMTARMIGTEIRVRGS